jgi:hypothetical protein
LVSVLLQLGPRPPLSPAETLLDPQLLRAIQEQPTSPIGIHTIEGAVETIAGSDETSGDILLACALDSCQVALQAAQKLQRLIDAKRIDRPARTIYVTALLQHERVHRARAVIYVAQVSDRPTQVYRGLWSTASIGDEVVEIFSKQVPTSVDSRPFERFGLDYEAYGVPQTTIAANVTEPHHAAFIAAASAYFLATLPNAGAEALLSHLTVGAHARLAEDGRRAVAQMGNQQRAGADVLIMFGQAIEREQRRMRSFERFMPAPVDPMLRSRIADMEKGITSVWTSMGITSSPFVPAAERIRGRGGEDRRVPARVKPGSVVPVDPPTAFLKFDNPDLIQYELANFIDGKRSISDIRDAVSAEFGALPLPSVVDYFERLAKSGAISLK